MLEIRHWLTGEVIRIIDRYADLFVLPDIDASGETAMNLKSADRDFGCIDINLTLATEQHGSLQVDSLHRAIWACNPEPQLWQLPTSNTHSNLQIHCRTNVTSCVSLQFFL